MVAGSLVLCALAYAPFAALQRPKHPLSGSVVASMAGLMVVCTAVAFVTFFALISEIGPMRATVITYLNPAVAVLLGVTVLGEHFGLATGAGFVLVLGGCFLATRPLRPHDEKLVAGRWRGARNGPGAGASAGARPDARRT